MEKLVKKSQDQLNLTIKIINSINSASEDKSVINTVLKDIKKYLDCDATAIRIKENKTFPYASVFGFDETFVQTESNILDPNSSICGGSGAALCSHQCLCGLVLSGKSFETPLVTDYGSIVTDDVNNLPEMNLDGLVIRNYCGKVGYHSILLVPLYTNKKEIIGLLQCNDTNKNWYSKDDVKFIEQLSGLISLAIARQSDLIKNREISEQFRDTLSVSNIASWNIDMKTSIFVWEAGAEQVMGYSIEIGKTKLSDLMTAIIHPYDIDPINEKLSSLSDGESDYVEYQASTDGENWRYYKSIAKLDGGFLKGITIDITDSKISGQEAEDSSRYLNSIIEGMNAGIILVNPKTNKIIETNTVSEDLFGLTSNELKSIKSTKLLSPHYFKQSKNLNKISSQMLSNTDSMLSQKNGNLIPVNKIIMKTILNTDEHFVVILFDISSQKALEQQLNHSQKMESIGSLAAGVAHEINTPIQYIGDNEHFLKESFDLVIDIVSSYKDLLTNLGLGENCDEAIAELTKKQDDADIDFLLEEIPQAIDQSIDGVNRVATIVKAMKKFSHPGQVDATITDINEIVENTLIVARNEWKYVAESVVELEDNLPQIPLHSDDFSQVVLNLIVNASHAISDMIKEGEKGVIKITTKSTVDSIILTIGDTGSGIKPENYSKIFNPFFTTKAVGKGTGQGLAMAYSIITEKHSGKIEFESEVGAGTTFIITLPRK